MTAAREVRLLTRDDAVRLVAEHGSARAAARAAGCSTRTLSRRLAGVTTSGYNPPAAITPAEAVEAWQREGSMAKAAAACGVSKSLIQRRVIEHERANTAHAEAEAAERRRRAEKAQANAVAASAQDGHWWKHAACQGEDTELFFHVSTSESSRHRVDRAKAVCARCPVTAACLRDALSSGTAADYGVLGGLTADERRALKRRERDARRAKAKAAAS